MLAAVPFPLYLTLRWPRLVRFMPPWQGPLELVSVGAEAPRTTLAVCELALPNTEPLM